VAFGVKVVEGEAAEVGEEDVAGSFVLAAGVDEVVDVGEGLGLGGVEGVAGGLVFDEELAGPEEVDEACGSGETADGLLEGGEIGRAHV